MISALYGEKVYKYAVITYITQTGSAHVNDRRAINKKNTLPSSLPHCY